MDLTWSAAETTAEAAEAEDETAGFEPGPEPDPAPFPLPPPPPPPPVDSVSEPPPEYGPEPDNSPKFSVMVTDIKPQGLKSQFQSACFLDSRVRVLSDSEPLFLAKSSLISKSLISSTDVVMMK